jgi:lipopolysaccharide exporter
MSASDKATYPGVGAPDLAGGAEMRGHAIRGAAWMMTLRWAVRLLSVANTAILARLLTPADFGLMAMATLALSVIAVFGIGGEDLALIRLGRPGREYLDSAWTLKIITSIILFMIALAAAPLARLYFHLVTVELLLYLISVRVLLDGFTNIGTVYFRIDLDFAKEFRYLVYRKVLDVALVISCVLVIRNFWGLAIAIVLSKIAEVMLSYAMHPFRPRFRLTKVREIWSFSSWTLLVWLGAHFAGKADEYIVGATNSPATMGAYTVGSEVAVSPTIDLIQPVMRAMFPVYSRLLGEPERLRAAAVLVIGATASVCLATGLGVSGIARELTFLLLGRQWEQATSLVFWLGIGAIPVGMNFCIYSIMNVTNKLRLTAITVWARLALLVPTLIVAGRWGGAPAIAAAQAGLGFVALFGDFFMLRLAVRFRAADILACLYRPVAAALAMVFVLQVIDRATSLPLFTAMVVKIVCGAIAYLGVLTAVWLLAGRPDGIEALALQIGARIIRRRGQSRDQTRRERGAKPEAN